MKKLAFVLMTFLLSGCGVEVVATHEPSPIYPRIWMGPYGYEYRGYPGYYYRPHFYVYPRYRHNPPIFRFAPERRENGRRK